MVSERILVMERKRIPAEWLPTFGWVSVSPEQLQKALKQQPLTFLPRREMEQEARYKQIIPYLILRDARGALLCYRRQGSEKRLHRLYSLGIGGHVNAAQDARGDFWQTVLQGLRREAREETGLLFSPEALHFYGFINEERTPVGTVHWGWVFAAQLTPQQKATLTVSAELGSYEFCSDSVFLQNKPHEFWSELALKLLQKREA